MSIEKLQEMLRNKCAKCGAYGEHECFADDTDRCKKCNRDMGYNPQEFELCAPCELGFTNDKEENKSDNDAGMDGVTTRG